MPTIVGQFTTARFEHDKCGEADPWRDYRWDAGHPYGYRVWIRGRLPWWLINEVATIQNIDPHAPKPTFRTAPRLFDGRRW
jgi:hypothetical protein